MIKPLLNKYVIYMILQFIIKLLMLIIQIQKFIKKKLIYNYKIILISFQ